MAKTVLVVGEAGYSAFFKQALAERGHDDVDVVDVDLLRHRVQAYERQAERLRDALEAINELTSSSRFRDGIPCEDATTVLRGVESIAHKALTS